MGFLHIKKKKNPASSGSVLSEAEIQKKLYGEFSCGSSPVVIGDREHGREPSPAPFRAPIPEKEPAFDLFSAQVDALGESMSMPPKIPSGISPSEAAPRRDPVRSFEKRTPEPVGAHAVPKVMSPEMRGRFSSPHLNGKEIRFKNLTDFASGLMAVLAALSRKISDPRQVLFRRFLYWGAAALVVFFLFWGVNVLNLQREEALQTRYKIAAEKNIPAPVVREAAPVLPDTVHERPVVITPAPVRSAKPRVSERRGGAASVGDYVIQVVTYPTRPDADQIVDVFTRAGLRAFVKEDARASGRIFYVVFIGKFRTASDAQNELTKFRNLEIARPFQDAFVKMVRS